MHESEFPIPEPCGESWDEMAGDERRRHCERCRHAVYDLSSLTEKRARRLLQDPPPDLCVSYLSDERGEIQFRKPESSVSRGLSLGVALGLAACSNPLSRTTGSAPVVKPAASASTALATPSVPAEAAASAAASAAPALEPQTSSVEPAASVPGKKGLSAPAPRLHRTAGVPAIRPSLKDDGYK